MRLTRALIATLVAGALLLAVAAAAPSRGEAAAPRRAEPGSDLAAALDAPVAPGGHRLDVRQAKSTSRRRRTTTKRKRRTTTKKRRTSTKRRKTTTRRRQTTVRAFSSTSTAAPFTRTVPVRPTTTRTLPRPTMARAPPSYLSPQQYAMIQKTFVAPTWNPLLYIPEPSKYTIRPPPRTLRPPWLTKWTSTTSRTRTTTVTKTATRTSTTRTTTLPPDAPGYVPKNCLPADPNVNPTLLDCFITSIPSLRYTIMFYFWDAPGSSTSSPRYFDATGSTAMTAAEKQDVRTAFRHAWNWLSVGSTDYANKPYPGWTTNLTVGGNIAKVLPNGGAETLWDQTDQAWPWFCAQVGHAYAVEILGLVPWTLRSLPYQAIQNTITGNMMYIHQSGPGDAILPYGHQARSPDTSPAHPAYIWTWLQSIGVLAAIKTAADKQDAQVKAIAKVLDWGRWHMAHFMGHLSSWENYNYYWGLRKPAAGQIIEGTVSTEPMLAYLNNTKFGWTAGCFGTSAFLQHVIRPLNIPVDNFADIDKTCSHFTVHFPSIDAYLTHGDDPYADTWGVGPYVAPAELLLVPGSQWQSWFGVDRATSCRNVGRRPMDLQTVFGYPSLRTFTRYCYDHQRGMGADAGPDALRDGSVINSFMYYDNPTATYKRHYEPEELLANGFYSMLETYRTTIGGCQDWWCWDSQCSDGSMKCAACMKTFVPPGP